MMTNDFPGIWPKYSKRLNNWAEHQSQLFHIQLVARGLMHCWLRQPWDVEKHSSHRPPQTPAAPAWPSGLAHCLGIAPGRAPGSIPGAAISARSRPAYKAGSRKSPAAGAERLPQQAFFVRAELHYCTSVPRDKRGDICRATPS